MSRFVLLTGGSLLVAAIWCMLVDRMIAFESNPATWSLVAYPGCILLGGIWGRLCVWAEGR